jgi:putative peptidoglycan lipid II flippase
MSKIFKASIIISISFAINKVLGLARQYLIANQFGFSPQIDAFNVANNMPDLIFSLFSGGALAMAFIPIFAEYLDLQGYDKAWKLFSKVISLLFIVTAGASLIVGLIAPLLVSSQIGVAPGFDAAQQALVVELLRINLIATLVFSVSGLITASLQAHKHFLLPAIAPIFYNLGIIFGAVVLAPRFGIYGLTYGVVIGSLLHLLIQLPALRRYKFKFSLGIDLKDVGVRKILQVMWPRVLTVLLIQITFLLRDNFASRLEAGSVTALTYGYFIMQVPETLIGSSIAIALLPSLSTFVSRKQQQEFSQALSTTIRVLIAASLLPTVLVFAILGPLVELVFDFSASNTQLLVWTTNAFMAGLVAHVLMEVLIRAFYAKQKALVPLYATLLRTVIFIVLGVALYQRTGAVGIAAIDSLTVAIEVIFLFVFLWPSIYQKMQIAQTTLRSILGCLLGIVIIWATFSFLHIPLLIQVTIASILAVVTYALFVIREAKMFIKL